MPAIPSSDATQLLSDLSEGRADAADELLAAVYEELRGLARRLLWQPGGQTLQPTALVHEAYLRLIDQSRTGEMGRTHFFNVAAQAMRQILVGHARRRGAEKRGGDMRRVSFGEAVYGTSQSMVDALSLDDALTALAELDQRQARIAELRFLAGMTIGEVAETLGVSPRTVELDWRMARAWLRRRLSEENSP